MHTGLSARPPQSKEITWNQQAELSQESGNAPPINNVRCNPRPACNHPCDMHNQGSAFHCDRKGRYSQRSASHPDSGRHNEGSASHLHSGRYNQGSASHGDRRTYNDGPAFHLHSGRYNEGSVSHCDRGRYNEGSASHLHSSRYNQGSAFHGDRGRYNEGSASHLHSGRYNQGSVYHCDRGRYNEGSASHPDMDRYNQGSASHPGSSSFNRGPASHTDWSRYNQGSVSHYRNDRYRDRYSQGSASHFDRDRYSQGSASHFDRDRYSQGSASHTDRSRYNQGSVSYSDRGRYNKGIVQSRKPALNQTNCYPAQQHVPRRCDDNQHAKFPSREAAFERGPVADPPYSDPGTCPEDAQNAFPVKHRGCDSQLYTSSHVKQSQTVHSAELCIQSPLMRGQATSCRPSQHSRSYSLSICSKSQSPLSKVNYPISPRQPPAGCPFVSPIKHDLTATYLSASATSENSDMSPVSTKLRFNNPPSQCEGTTQSPCFVTSHRHPYTQYSPIQSSRPWVPQCRNPRFDHPVHQNMSPPDYRFPSHMKAATSQYNFKPPALPNNLLTRPNPKQHPHTLPSRLTSLPSYTEVPSPQSGFPLFSRTSPSRNSVPPLNRPPLRPELPSVSITPQSVLAPCPKRCFTNHYGYLDYCPVPDLPSYTPNSLWWEEHAAPKSRKPPTDRRHDRHNNAVPDTGTRPNRDSGCSRDPVDVSSVGKRGGDAVRDVTCSKKMKVTQKSAPHSLLNQRRIKVLNKALGLARRSPKKPSRQSSAPSIETRGFEITHNLLTCKE